MGKINLLKISAIGAGFALGLGAVSLPAGADSGNWSAAKRDQINVNRNSNAGVGNGGEARLTRGPSGNWASTTFGEDGLYDRDPGRSQMHNRAANNDDRPQSAAGGGTGVYINPRY